uniref:Uncharacterized protein n=1 Tax=Rhizophora mucronata TaxID=61149 RepID=A0A2P2MA63_RHIMU
MPHIVFDDYNISSLHAAWLALENRTRTKISYLNFCLPLTVVLQD